MIDRSSIGHARAIVTDDETQEAIAEARGTELKKQTATEALKQYISGTQHTA